MAPMFDKKNVLVIYVLGGPGAGKGTQCGKLVEEYGFCHLSAGDLLRAEQQREGSIHSELIRTVIREGRIVPTEITIKLLEHAMSAALKENRNGVGWSDGKSRFLIDGFPRKMDQALKFDDEVCTPSLVLVYQTTEEVMLKRLMKRGESSGRDDDNAETIKKRFVTDKEMTMPVINYYAAKGIVAEIDSTSSAEEVHENAREVVEKTLAAQEASS
ncbi:UMP-CMP kinase [Athelia psychrophila]|uniref:Uridylate kinase n=1 Tax=Athelia psychrophila TaxID=1759441 RepID=A0A165XRJ6_9AGAM|nr:UMP-CMP kinase [Fibularhizoctonia sp. CBS 109695]